MRVPSGLKLRVEGVRGAGFEIGESRERAKERHRSFSTRKPPQCLGFIRAAKSNRTPPPSLAQRVRK